jgi:hypothetical protein
MFTVELFLRFFFLAEMDRISKMVILDRKITNSAQKIIYIYELFIILLSLSSDTA